MKPIVYPLLICLTAISGAQALAENRCSHLSSGERVCEPFVVADAEEFAVFGSGEVDPLAKLLKPFGLVPLSPPEAQGRAVVILDFLNYKKTDVGPYQEFIAMVLVAEINQPDHYGWYMKNLVLDGDDKNAVRMAVQGGRESVGYPKFFGKLKFVFPTKGNGKAQFSVASVDSRFWQLAFSDEVTNTAVVPDKDNEASVVTTENGKNCWTVSKRKFSEGAMHVARPGAFSKPTADTPIGRYFDEIGFRADYFQYNPYLSIQLYTPGELCFK